MAGVFGRLKKAAEYRSLAKRANRRILELEAAKQILAEVFGVSISDVEEMISNRYKDACSLDNEREETEIWPKEFWVAE